MSAYKHLRVEEEAPKAQVVEMPRQAPPTDHDPLQALQAELDKWRKLAIQNGERLAYAENQLKDLRTAADDARARFGKYKSRLDSANERVNAQQVELTLVSAERDELKAALARQDVVARKVHEFRKSILEGPLWDLFVEHIGPPTAGERTTP